MTRLLALPTAGLTVALTLALTLAAAPAPAATPTATPTAAATAAAHRAAKAAKKSWVVQAQRRLNALRCNAGPADGRVGQWTRSAVIRFQSRHGLKQTGRLDPATRKRLKSPQARRCDSRPIPARSGSGRRIVVSQAQNWIWLVDRRGRIVAQGGTVDNPGVLRPGSYGTGSYCGRPARVRLNQSGAVWMDDFVRFAPCGIGFHRIPRYKSTGKQMHPDWWLGTNFDASHGCIRLSAGLARKVWTWTDGVYTKVRVV